MATPTTLTDTLTLAATADRNLKTSVPAVDALAYASNITTLYQYIHAEIEARFPEAAVLVVDMGEHRGLDAISEYFRLKLLHDAPDLLPLALERAMAEMWQTVFDGKPEAEWPQ